MHSSSLNIACHDSNNYNTSGMQGLKWGKPKLARAEQEQIY